MVSFDERGSTNPYDNVRNASMNIEAAVKARLPEEIGDGKGATLDRLAGGVRRRRPVGVMS